MFRFGRNARARRLARHRNPAIDHALQLLQKGQSGEAAKEFSQIAQELEASNHPRRAANLHAQAAHAFIDAKEAASAQAQSSAALRLFLDHHMRLRAGQFYANITRKLRSQGMAAVAETLQNEFGSGIGSIPEPQTTPPKPPAGHLPVACTQCGGPIRPDEADWIDDHTIQCLYCGALIQAT
jgi:hypothetical protein